jgi:GTP-binding protein HflX
LVESFNATLEEAVMADFLVHLLDASHPRVLEFHETTMKVLSELGAEQKQTLTVFNKIDRVEDPLTRAALRLHHPDALFVSAHTGEGLDILVGRLGELVGGGSREVILHLPHDRTDLMARIHREGVVHETGYEEEFIRIRTSVPERFRESLSPFIVL